MTDIDMNRQDDIRTRYGRQTARGLVKLADGHIAGYVGNDLHLWDADGHCLTYKSSDDLDLIQPPPKPQPVWLYVPAYPDCIGSQYCTLEAARKWLSANCLHILQIDITGTDLVMRKHPVREG